jgi:hypothetical protein
MMSLFPQLFFVLDQPPTDSYGEWWSLSSDWSRETYFQNVSVSWICDEISSRSRIGIKTKSLGLQGLVYKSKFKLTIIIKHQSLIIFILIHDFTYGKTSNTSRVSNTSDSIVWVDIVRVRSFLLLTQAGWWQWRWIGLLCRQRCFLTWPVYR